MTILTTKLYQHGHRIRHTYTCIGAHLEQQPNLQKDQLSYTSDML